MWYDYFNNTSGNLNRFDDACEKNTLVSGCRDKVSIDPSEIANTVGYWKQYEQGLEFCSVDPAYCIRMLVKLECLPAKDETTVQPITILGWGFY